MKEAHSIFGTIRTLRGNQRACVITEPLWSLPNNLILPFASVYMSAIGLNDAQIGMTASIGLGIQFIWALFSGAIVDKYGRCRTTLVFGLLSWTIPCMLWAGAQGYRYFIIAASLNSMWRITGNSFSCLIVEDGDTEKLISIYTILNLIGLAAGFLSPLLGLLIGRFALVPVMRMLYVLALLMMTGKFLLQYRMMRESNIGIRRMEESRKSSLLSMTFGGWGCLISSLRSTKLALFIVLIILMNCFSVIQTAFWPLFVTSGYGIENSLLSVFPFVKSITTCFVYLFVTSRIRLNSIRNPLYLGLGMHLAGLVLLISCIPLGSAAIWAVFLSAVFDAFAFTILSPLTETLLSVNIPARERARVNSLITALILLVSAPIGRIAGQLSALDRIYPLMLNIGLLLLEMLIAAYSIRHLQK